MSWRSRCTVVVVRGPRRRLTGVGRRREVEKKGGGGRGVIHDHALMAWRRMQ